MRFIGGTGSRESRDWIVVTEYVRSRGEIRLNGVLSKGNIDRVANMIHANLFAQIPRSDKILQLFVASGRILSRAITLRERIRLQIS